MRTSLRWAVPAAAATVIVTTAAVSSSTASAAPELPPRTAAQLLVDVSQAQVDGAQGTVRTSTALGLPALPSAGGTGATNLQSLISGDHTLRVWTAGPDQQRVALVGDLAEYNVVRNGQDVWTYESQSRAVTHLTLPPQSARPADPSLAMADPQRAAEQALAAVDPTTEVTVDRAVTVAGRSAYQLVLTPRDPGTLVGSVRIALDSEVKAPLRVQVFARGASKPALEVGWSEVSFTKPDASRFTFTPPTGSTVTESPLGDAPTEQPSETAPSTVPAMVGTGWSSILVLPAPVADPAADDPSADQQTQDLVNRVSRPVDGGRVITTSLITVLLADDGRTLVGSVPVEALQAAARG